MNVTKAVFISNEMNNLEILQKLWELLYLEFPSDDDCLAELCRRAAEEGKLECRACRNRDVEDSRDGRVIRCSICKSKTRFTSDTYLHKIKLPRIWLGAIWLMEHGVVFSASAFHKVAKVAYSTAFHVNKKLALVMQDGMEDEAPSVSSRLFAKLFCKRSTETPAGMHPRDEEPGVNKTGASCSVHSAQADYADYLFYSGQSGQSGQLQDPLAASSDGVQDVANACSCFEVNSSGASAADIDPASSLEGHEKEIYDVLGKEPVAFAELTRRFSEISASDLSVALTMLEIGNFVSSVGGERFVRKAQKPVEVKADPQIQATVDQALRFIREKYHGISWKYLQLYVAIYWSNAKRARWRNGGLMKACMRFRVIADLELYGGASPELCRLPLGADAELRDDSDSLEMSDLMEDLIF